jgi:hydrogenase-4 membrane subunit HyfE
METDLPDPQLVATARQIMDRPEQEEDEALQEETPLYITWFALGHAAVLLYLALHALKIMTPMERGLAVSSIVVVGLSLALLLRAKLRTAMAMAETVEPASRRRFAAEAED